MIDFKQLTEQMGDLEERAVLAAIREVAEQEPEHIRDAIAALSDGMEIVGERFDSLEYFVGDLIFAGEIFSEAIELMRPQMAQGESHGPAAGKKVILATVEGDLHDIGKNIVRSTLEAKGFTVVDLGVNVSPAVIVSRTIEEGAHIIALSAVLTSSVEAMQRTVEACVSAGIRDKVSIVIGGACTSEAIAKRIKADYYGYMPDDTADYCLSVR